MTYTLNPDGAEMPRSLQAPPSTGDCLVLGGGGGRVGRVPLQTRPPGRVRPQTRARECN